MSKKQIKLTQDNIRKMINEAIHSYSFNGEGFNDEPDNKFDSYGNPKYPDGVFSTDSEEGEALKDYAKKYDEPKDIIWNQRERKLIDAEDNVTGAKWSNTLDSLWDTDKKLDRMSRDEFGDEEEESARYDRPFGDMDDIENQWGDEPGYEEDEEDIVGEWKKVRLNEEGLRNFISYSVARLLKEAWRPYDDGRGGIDYEYSYYGNESMQIEFDPWEYDDQMAAFQEAVEEDGMSTDMFDDGGEFGDIWPITVKVYYTVSHGMKGDYDVPDDPDEIEVTGWDAGTHDLPSQVGRMIEKALQIYFNGYFDPYEQIELNEENLGVTFHSNGESTYKPENPYKDMTWDEYCAAKKREQEEEKEREELEALRRAEREGEKPNLGIMTYIPGKKRNDEPEEGEERISISSDDLFEMVNECVRRIVRKR